MGYYDIRRISDITRVVIPFFERFPLKSQSKRRQFEVFREIAYLMQDKAHFTREGLSKILELRDRIKVARQRKYTSKSILSTFRSRNPQRLYAEHRTTK